MPMIEILMPVCDGEAFLAAQLASIAAQRGVDWRLTVSDDSTGPGSARLLDAFAATQAPGRVVRRAGPRRGAAANLLSLLGAARPGAIVALADQDDVWRPEKLRRAQDLLASAGAHPAAVFARRLTADRHLARLCPERAPRRDPRFADALVENVAPGNTLVLNAAAVALAQRAAPHAQGIVAHDWWLYQLLTGAGGVLLYDPVPALLYRQHGGNLVGAAPQGTAGALRRLARAFSGRHRAWTAATLAALTPVADEFDAPRRRALDDLRRLHTGGPAVRLAALLRLAPRRQGRGETALLWVQALAGRL